MNACGSMFSMNAMVVGGTSSFGSMLHNTLIAPMVPVMLPSSPCF